MVRARAPGWETMLTVDINALGEIVRLLSRCYRAADCADDFGSVLDRIAASVSDIRWDNKIAASRALWWMLDKGDRDRARECISNEAIADCTDPEVITVYLDLNGDRLSYNERTTLFDRIIELTEEEDIRLQYTCAKGVSQVGICDMEEATSTVQSAIDRYGALGESDRTTYGDHQFAHALQLLGVLKQDGSMIRQAAEQFQLLIDSASERRFTPLALAEYSRELGKCNAVLGDHATAIQHYIESDRTCSTPLARIQHAESLLKIGELANARKMLRAIPADSLSEPNRQDYAIACALLAGASLEAQDIEFAKAELRQFSSNDPYFIQMRDEYLIGLLEAVPRSSAGRISRLLRAINRYVSLNPNVFGIGIDINRMLDDVSSDSD